MAVPARRPSKKRVSKQEAGVRIVNTPSAHPKELTPIQVIVGQGYACGVTIAKLTRLLQYQICPQEPDDAKRIKKVRLRIRKWLATQKMRDFIYAEAQMMLDLESPAIMRGVARKAKAGRVDAARLALELNGRHSPHTEVQPAAINIVFAGVPRPTQTRPQIDDPNLVDYDPDEVVEVDDDGT